jgi:hypothetical protein
MVDNEVGRMTHEVFVVHFYAAAVMLMWMFQITRTFSPDFETKLQIPRFIADRSKILANFNLDHPPVGISVSVPSIWHDICILKLWVPRRLRDFIIFFYAATIH